MSKKPTTEIAETKENKPVLNLKNDIVFKAFFSRKGNEKFLIDFLESLLETKIESIEIREEVNLEQLKNEEKSGRLDLQAKLGDGTIVNIELQMRNEHNIEERTTYYSSKVISRETKRGTDYKDINQVIMINILGYEMFGFDEYISKTAIVLDKPRDYEVLRGIQWYFIELPKFRRLHPDMNEEINQWLLFIDNWKEGVKMAGKENKIFERARKEMNYLTGDAAVQRLAELREKWEMDRVSAINYATRNGEQKGAKKEKIEIAKKMLKKGMSIGEIIELTNLSEEEIKKIKI